jgi:hypothetical protein
MHPSKRKRWRSDTPRSALNRRTLYEEPRNVPSYWSEQQLTPHDTEPAKVSWRDQTRLGAGGATPSATAPQHSSQHIVKIASGSPALYYAPLSRTKR